MIVSKLSPLVLTLLAIVPPALSQNNESKLRRAEKYKPKPKPGPDEELHPHQGCELLLKEKHEPQAALVGASFEMSIANTNPDYHADNELGATASTCSNGQAGGYSCNAVDLLSLVTLQELNGASAANDIWGWTDAGSGREFAIIGLREGTGFVEISDPYNPVYLGFLPTATSNSSWRDIKTIGDYALIVSEASGHGMQIFDMIQLLSIGNPPSSFSATLNYNGFGNAHNVFINEDTGFVYAVGTSTCGGGLHIVDMNDPLSPTQAGCYSADGYSHDVQCVVYNGPDSNYVGREICFGSNEDTITIVDVTDKSNLVQLARRTYANDHYTHQGWLTGDHSYFIFNDELDEMRGGFNTRTHVMDVRSLTNPTYTGYHEGRTAAIDHNLYVSGDLVYQANYRAGLNILRIVDVGNSEFEEVGFFDVWANSDSANFNGAWSNYPYFPSGVVVVSGIEQGLFVLKYDPNSPTPAPQPPTTAPPTPSPTPCQQADFKLTILTDNYPQETSWTLDNLCTSQREAEGGNYQSTATTFVEDECVPSGEYTFIIRDTYGDGICCGYGSGSYIVEYNGNVVKEGGQFGSSESTTFGSCGGDPTPAPVQPTPAPVDPTPAPVQPTPAPVDPTPAPVNPTPAPVNPTPAPADPTPAPVDPTPAPIQPTSAPVSPTPAPVDPTPAPVDPTAAPIAPTPAPVDPTPAPVDPTAAPITPTLAPVSPTSAPISSPPVASEQTLAAIVCGGSNGCRNNAEMVDPTESHEVRCCSETAKDGWVKKNNCEVWGASKVPTCFHGEDLATAEAICQAEEARLCTAEELYDKCAKGSGCGHDSDLIWSSFSVTVDPIPPVAPAHYLACGGSQQSCAGTIETADNDEYHEVRCCSTSLIQGWSKKNGCDVWSASEVPICFHKENFVGAKSICAAHGARLCTTAELLSDCSRGTGCNHDKDMIWSSTPV